MRRSAVFVLCLGALAATAACSSDSAVNPADATPSRAFSIWSPGPHESCTKEQHDAYAVVGPDGKLYPTWHPPTGPGGCSFGHEHGRDPHGSNLYDGAGGLPFGVANEALAVSDPANPGTRTTWATRSSGRTAWTCSSRAPGGAIFTGKCDVLTKLHQGTHSKDAFTNNLHELVYHIKCSDGTEMHVTMLTAIGTPGEFVRSCDHSVHITVGPPTPANSPDGGGFRAIPDRACVEQFMLVAAGPAVGRFLRAPRDVGDVEQRPARGRPHAGVLQSVLPGPPAEPVPRSGARAGGRPADRRVLRGHSLGRARQRRRLRRRDQRRPGDGDRVRRPGVTVQRRGPLRGYQRQPAQQRGWAGGLVHRRLRPEWPDARRFPARSVSGSPKMDNAIGVDAGGPVIGNNRNYAGPGVHAAELGSAARRSAHRGSRRVEAESW